MKRTIAIAFLAGMTALAAACAGTGKPAGEAPDYETLTRLEQALGEAAASGVADLAPDGFREASDAADAAREAARKAKSDVVQREASHGLNRLARAEADAGRARDILRDVLAPRERALAAGASERFGADMVRADARLRDVARLVEKGDIEEAKRRRAPLIDTYLQLELDALKKRTDQAVEAAIARAEEAGADKLAPKTLGLARDELDVARSILEANRRDTERADAHAHRAVQLADRAAHIAELVKDFDRLDYTDEDVVLWYQDQLAAVTAPTGAEPVFDAPNREVVEGLTDRVATVVSRAQDLEARVGEYTLELSAESAQRERMEQAERETRERFDRVQSLFSPDEADVFLQRRNVLIAAHGFWFPSGASEIEAVNFGLLNRIVRAIGEFPGSRVEVMGHTDAAGDDKLNLALSQARADKVARFLVDVGGLPAERVTARGFGETRPVATNDTKEGRARNRRVEVLIVNE